MPQWPDKTAVRNQLDTVSENYYKRAAPTGRRWFTPVSLSNISWHEEFREAVWLPLTNSHYQGQRSPEHNGFSSDQQPHYQLKNHRKHPLIPSSIPSSLHLLHLPPPLALSHRKQRVHRQEQNWFNRQTFNSDLFLWPRLYKLREKWMVNEPFNQYIISWGVSSMSVWIN